ncbi:hypothetical protein [Shewanella youngdeokensis]|uniref:HNH endonuclease n=1 Tax=Shewanella youngdeokensis TaxID=2999068 RepID=A0ABZ0JY05_9GAMM|nr:hypothetical protein RGE70_14315 [Shewanella sp. DAU334]
MSDIHPKILEQAKKVTAKRAKTVIDHIIKHGSLSTEELKELYGYNHAPRAARDVREAGIPLETFKVTASDGRRIGAYRFGDPEQIENNKLGGRQTFSKAFKETLIGMNGERCHVSGIPFGSRYLQIDHRTPYEVGGDEDVPENVPEKFMLLSGTAQRQKSWECEHCPNLLGAKDLDTCNSCYWAYPEDYSHAATRPVRIMQLGFEGSDVEVYDQLKEASEKLGKPLQEYIVDLLKQQG